MFWPKAIAHRLVTLLAGDVVCVELATFCGRLALAPANYAAARRGVLPVLLATLPMVWLGLLYLADFYAVGRRRLTSAATATNLAAVVVAASVLIALLAMAIPALNLGRRFYMAEIGSAAVLFVGWRLSVERLLGPHLDIRVAVLGAGSRAQLLSEEMARLANAGYRALDALSLTGQTAPAMVAVGGFGSVDLGSYAIRPNPNVDVLVVTEPEHSPVPTQDLLQWRMTGTWVVDFESFYEHLAGKVPVPLVREQWLVFGPGSLRPLWMMRIKRMIDVVVAGIIAILCAPLALLAAICIKLESSGRIIYSQQRVGENGRIFLLHKFRSMREDAEAASGPVWAAFRDPRVTRVGRIIRHTRIDELPQLWNVLKGEMSLIGPRPERPEIVERLARAIPLYTYRHLVKPGITGWAQVSLGYGATVEDAREKLSYDLYYMKNWSLFFDFQIFLQTIKAVLLGRGSR